MTREAAILVHVTLALVIIGLIAVYSAGTIEQIGEAEGHTFARVLTQLAHVGLGLAALVLASRFDYHHFRSRPVLYGLVGLAAVLLVLVLVFGIEVKGARRWLPVLGQTIQPSDFAKLALVALLAVKLSENQAELQGLMRGFFPPLALAFAFAGLVVLERDIGTPIVMCATALFMVFVAGSRLRHLLLGAGSVLVLFVGYVLATPHAISRITAFMRPWEYREKAGFQLLQALYAIARGGLWGRGAGAGQGKLDYIFAAESDFVFAVWGEEMGLAGALVVVVLFAAFVVLAFRIAIKARDTLGMLLALGIGCVIGLQALLNLGVTTGMLPTKGLTLPFLSAGGTATVVYLAMAGILINIALQAPDGDEGKRAAV
jgi:cell division protein FtsW